jgi:hypothetical protein
MARIAGVLYLLLMLAGIFAREAGQRPLFCPVFPNPDC